MYSLVLMTALAPGADVTPPPAPAFAAAPLVMGCSGCSGFAGCAGTVVSYGCSGSCFGCSGSCSGCYGSCHGGLFHHKHHKGHGLFGHRHSCHGCAGYSCSGWNCFGSCSGGCAGYGAGYGSAYGAGYGSGYAGGYPGGGPATSYWFAEGVINYGIGTLAGTPWSCHGGCYGGYYGFGSTYGPPPHISYGPGSPPVYGVYGNFTNTNPPTIPVPVDPVKKDETKKDETKKDDDTKKDDTKKDEKGMGASVKFRLPADAKLFVDGRPTALTGSERVFTTPPLARGRFFYDVRAELMVDGKAVVEEKRVIVEAGADVTESFATLIAAAASKGDPVAGK